MIFCFIEGMLGSFEIVRVDYRHYRFSSCQKAFLMFYRKLLAIFALSSALTIPFDGYCC
jgi:hypothetical protein